ncbi:hypothetical protein OSTOST_13493, partial [Ostertagia ostertagi]
MDDPNVEKRVKKFVKMREYGLTANEFVRIIRTRTDRVEDTCSECEARGGEAIGLQCHFKPDVYMLSVLLTFGTFALAYGLNNFRHSRFFGSTFRNALSDFGVVIAIVVMTAFSLAIGLDVPSLHVPQQIR